MLPTGVFDFAKKKKMNTFTRVCRMTVSLSCIIFHGFIVARKIDVYLIGFLLLVCVFLFRVPQCKYGYLSIIILTVYTFTTFLGYPVEFVSFYNHKVTRCAPTS